MSMENMSIGRSLLVLGMLAPGCIGEGLDPTEPRSAGFEVAFQDGVVPTAGYAGTRDTMLEQNAAKSTHGGDSSLSVSGDTPGGSGKDDVALVRWELAATIPGDAIVSAASITLTVSDKAAQSYGVYEVLRPWTESQASWNLTASGVSWASAGAKGPSDRGDTKLGSITAAATGPTTIALNAAGLAMVQKWVADSNSNHGVIFADAKNDNRLEFRASEYSTKSARPRLTVSWDIPGGETDDGGETEDVPFTLVPTPGRYRGTCDGSGAVALDHTHFLDFNDESQVLRVYAQGSDAGPVQSFDVHTSLGLAPGAEADLEDAARVGDRVYVITSHARDKNGTLEPSRYRFFALDLTGAVPGLKLKLAGTSTSLLADMLVASNWLTPDPAILTLLASTSQLAKGTVASLAPKEQGINIEGLAALGTTGELVLGLRNPRSGSRAILVTLRNPAEVVAGGKARFGAAILLELGGQSVRGMAWSASHEAVLLIAGPRDEAQGPFALWKWSGVVGSPPVKVQDITAPAAGGPEAIVPYPGTKDVQVIFDMGSFQIDGDDCKAATATAQYFTDVVVHVD